MFRKSALARTLSIAFAGGTWGATAFAQAAAAPATEDAASAPGPQRVEITGSSIRRTSTEGALPVTTLTQEDIEKSGATSVTDLIQMLPSMQGFVPASSSVNGGGAGVTTAAVHSLPSKYTLVLLDGQRVAPSALGATQGGGFGVNLESIPLDAIERVEVLTDGASAIYGSDAIAGVVNFVLRKDKTDGAFSATYDKPQHAGARSWSASLSKGIGDLSRDGFNLMGSISRDHQDALFASQRSASRRGAVVPFTSNGTHYLFDGANGNTEPANIVFSAVPAGSAAGTAPSTYSINPYYAANGNCGTPFANPLTDAAVLGGPGVSCRFNYAATVQDIPSSDRTSGVVRASVRMNESTTLWASAALSDFSMRSQFAPGAQNLALSPTRLPSLYDEYLAPYLATNGLSLVGTAKIGYRAASLGGRADDWDTSAQHLAGGIEGAAYGWDYRANAALSHARLTDTAAGGYADYDMLSADIADGSYDPIMGTGVAAAQSSVLHSQLSRTNSDLDSFHADAQHDLFELPGGSSVLDLGADYVATRYKADFSDLLLSSSGFSTQPASSDYPVGGAYGATPFDASRANWGAYAEWLLPAFKHFEATVSGRYDSYGRVHSDDVFSSAVDPATGLQDLLPPSDLGNTFSAYTGKLSLRMQPVDSLLLRGSIGTGFKAPSLADIAGALGYAGQTSGSYACPFPGSVGCAPGSSQYDVLIGPNSESGAGGLKPEHSTQWTAGFRVEPGGGLSAGLDLWNVQLRDQIESSGIAEQVGFANPATYANLFVNPYQDPAGYPTIAYKEIPFNGGTAQYRGLDWDLTWRARTPLGPASLQWTGTQMLRQSYTNGPGQPANTDLGKYGPDQQVVFRTISNLVASLQTGAFVDTLSVHFKSGYHDAQYSLGSSVYLANPDGSLGDNVAFGGLHVPACTTFDWQTRYDWSKDVNLTLGVKNFADRIPPFTLQTSGGGNQVGYDGRYADPVGRQFYASVRYGF